MSYFEGYNDKFGNVFNPAHLCVLNNIAHTRNIVTNGKYGLVEIKLGGDHLIEDGAANLNKLESILDIDRMNRPAFKMVVPISSLKD